MAEKINKKEEVNRIGCNCSCINQNRRKDDYTCPLEMELASSYYWSGTFCKDYWFFVCNWHPLLGMLMSHPAHPWSKLERFATWLFSICFSLVPIALQLQGGRSGKLKEGNSLAQLQLLLYVSLPLMLWESVLYWINIMDIYLKGKNDCLVKCSQVFKNFILLISVAGGALFAVVAIAFIMPEAHAPMSKLVLSLLNSRAQMWVLWFPLHFFPPYFGFLPVWFQEKRKASTASDDVPIADEETGSVPIPAVPMAAPVASMASVPASPPVAPSPEVPAAGVATIAPTPHRPAAAGIVGTVVWEYERKGHFVAFKPDCQKFIEDSYQKFTSGSGKAHIHVNTSGKTAGDKITVSIYFDKMTSQVQGSHNINKLNRRVTE